MRKFIFLVLVLFLAINLISGAPPFLQTASSDGYQIKSPLIDAVKVNTHFDFNFHVFNMSNGAPVSNATVQCVFHLYNQTGDHIYYNSQVKNDLVTEHGVVNEWVERVNGENFSSLGIYNYIIQCNSSSRGGFFASQVLVTNTGFIMSTPQITTEVMFISILMLLIVIFFIYGLNSMFIPVKIFCLSISVILIIFGIGYVLQLSNINLGEFTSMVDGINPVYILFISFLSVGGVGIVIYLIMSSIQSFHKTRYGVGE